MHDNDIKFYLTKLTPSTSYRIHCFSQNLRGRSEGIWMSAETLETAQHLIANSNADDVFGAERLLYARPFLMTLFVSIIIVSLALIMLGIFASIRVRNHRHVIELPHPSRTDTLYPDGQSASQTDVNATVFNENNVPDCCCGNDCCDEVLLTSGTVVQRRHNSQTTAKDTPDIIPSIGYISQNNLDKDQSIEYGKELLTSRMHHQFGA